MRPRRFGLACPGAGIIVCVSAIGAFAAFGCVTPVTQLVVAVRVDTSIPEQVNALDVQVTTPGAATHHVMATLSGVGDAQQTLGIRYVSGELGPVRIRATASGREFIVASRRTEFVRGESRLVTLVLTSACAGVTCAEDQTCEAGACVNAYTPGSVLPTWQGSFPEGMDAGPLFDARPEADAGSPDTSSLDASFPDDANGPDAIAVIDASLLDALPSRCAGDPLSGRIGNDCVPANACQVGRYTCNPDTGRVECLGIAEVRSAATVCRPSTGECDAPESCDGSGLSCPPQVSTAGLGCMGGVCDAMGRCSAACPAGAACIDPSNPCLSGTISCSSGAPVCVGLAPVPPGTVCRGATSFCDVPEICDGGTCPDDLFAPASTVCRPSRDLCDSPEICSGGSPTCPADRFAPATTVCRPSRDLCDSPESCSGVSSSCPTDMSFPVGRVCRAAMGPCDSPESCAGEITCPAATVMQCDAGADGGPRDAGGSDAFAPDVGRDAFAPDVGRDARVGAKG